MEAESLAQEALGLLAECGYRPAAIEALETLAAIYAELGAPDRAARLVGAVDSERASRGQPRPPIVAQRPEGLFQTLGASGLEPDRAAGLAMTIDQAIGYASRGRGSRQRPAEGWASLTPAELEVSRLVAEGLTNPQIGERLFISKRTVQTHLSHVFRKLGASKRAEVAAEVARRRV
jgi:DNA-binding CsgD family transcriptional regulator